mgnify:CR=1 FL=1
MDIRQTTNPHAERRIAVSERTVTEQQVIDAFNMAVPLDERMSLGLIFNKLFPELPKAGELILCWDDLSDYRDWCYFDSINNDGKANTIDYEGDEESYDNYRRQTPAERGEG